LHKLKNRVINFRVTDEELARLKIASDFHGARCLSDYARTVMLGIAESSSLTKETGGQIEDKIHLLDGRLTSVESELSRVIKHAVCLGEECRKPQE
jgi:hypothetical protein